MNGKPGSASAWSDPPFTWEQALTEASEAGDERPTWAYDWPAGQRQAADLAALCPRLTHCHVLDLGCGRGQLGQQALSNGAAQVTFADASAAVLSYLDRWIQHNRLQPQCRTLTYRWGQHLNPDYDLILGGDICYRPECFHDLAQTLAMTLRRPGSQALLSDPRQHIEDVFHKLLSEQGLTVSSERRPGPYTVLKIHSAEV